MHHQEEKKQRQRRRWIMVLVAIAVILVVAISLAMLLPSANQNTTPESSSQFPYDCYTSTFDVLQAQYEPEIPDAFILCPGTRIDIGTFANPAAKDYEVVGGDFPIIAIRPNVKIQCGLDGKRDNNCVLHGGFRQVLLQAHVPFVPDGGILPELHEFVQEGGLGTVVMADLDNFTIQGVTFTGLLEHPGSLRGLSMSLSHPGRNMRLEDCLWTNVTSTYGVIGASRNTYLASNDIPLPDRSVQVIISRCSFQGLVLSAPLIFSHRQVIAVEESDFSNVQLSALTEMCQFDSGLILDDGCAWLFFCWDGSICSLSDSCVEQYRSSYPAPILMSNDTDWSVSGRNTMNEELDCDVAVAELPVDGMYYCERAFETSSVGCRGK